MHRFTWLAVVVAIAPVSCAATMDPPVALANGRIAPRAHLVAPFAQDDDGSDMTLDVYPRVMFAQSDVSVQLRVARDPRSRSVELEWWSIDGGGGAHLITLEGEQAAIRHQYIIKRLDAGEYEVAAVLTRSDGTRVRRSTSVLVASR
jgi:hypothetical protein